MVVQSGACTKYLIFYANRVYSILSIWAAFYLMNFITVWTLTLYVSEVTMIFVCVRWLLTEHELNESRFGKMNQIATFIVSLILGALIPLTIMMFTLPVAHNFIERDVGRFDKSVVIVLMIGGILKSLASFSWVALFSREVCGLEEND